VLPKLYRFGRYSIFFWSNEDMEPIHVHICVGKLTSNATKVWLTRNGRCILAHNKGKIPPEDLNQIFETIEDNFFLIYSEWKSHFKTDNIKFFA